MLDGQAKRMYYLSMLTWHESKRRRNIARHGYDFAGADAIFDGPVLSWVDEREAYGEQRLCVLGWLHGRVMHLTYTDDGETMRTISLREATRHEAKIYFQQTAG